MVSIAPINEKAEFVHVQTPVSETPAPAVVETAVSEKTVEETPAPEKEWDVVSNSSESTVDDQPGNNNNNNAELPYPPPPPPHFGRGHGPHHQAGGRGGFGPRGRGSHRGGPPHHHMSGRMPSTPPPGMMHGRSMPPFAASEEQGDDSHPRGPPHRGMGPRGPPPHAFGDFGADRRGPPPPGMSPPSHGMGPGGPPMGHRGPPEYNFTQGYGQEHPASRGPRGPHRSHHGPPPPPPASGDGQLLSPLDEEFPSRHHGGGRHGHDQGHGHGLRGPPPPPPPADGDVNNEMPPFSPVDNFSPRHPGGDRHRSRGQHGPHDHTRMAGPPRGEDFQPFEGQGHPHHRQHRGRGRNFGADDMTHHDRLRHMSGPHHGRFWENEGSQSPVAA